jgi:adenylate cyclase
VTKAELLDNVWAGVVVAESALTRAVSLARAALGDSGRGQSVIETVSGRGYRFRATVEAGPPASGRHPTPVGAGHWRQVGAAVGSGLAALVLLAWLTWPAPLGGYLRLAGLGRPPAEPALPEEPSIAVLPFAVLGPEVQSAHLADGIADELIAGLGRHRDLFVIARSSAFAYRGTSPDVRRVGRELGVRYVVDGSLRASGAQAVVVAQLADARTGFQLWSGRYERAIGHVLDLQAEVSSEILQALGLRIADAEVERVGRESGASDDAYAAYVRARMHWYRMTQEDNHRAEVLLARVLTTRPHDPPAEALLASTDLAAYGFGWDPTPERLERGRAAAVRALDGDPFSSRAHAALAAANLWQGRRAEALAAARRAVELGPNSDLCFGVQATVLAADGAIGAAVRSLNRALRLNPRNPAPYWMLLGYLYQAGGDDAQAVATWEEMRAGSDLIPPRLALLGHYDDAGVREKAASLAREILAINPAFTAAMGASLAPRGDPRDAALLVDQLQRAGIR